MGNRHLKKPNGTDELLRSDLYVPSVCLQSMVPKLSDLLVPMPSTQKIQFGGPGGVLGVTMKVQLYLGMVLHPPLEPSKCSPTDHKSAENGLVTATAFDLWWGGGVLALQDIGIGRRQYPLFLIYCGVLCRVLQITCSPLTTGWKPTTVIMRDDGFAPLGG